MNGGPALHASGRGALQKAGNFKAVQVPYKGASPAITDLLGGHIPMAALSIASGMPHIQGGKVRGLAVTSAARNSALPDVPTVAEPGFPASMPPAGSASSSRTGPT